MGGTRSRALTRGLGDYHTRPACVGRAHARKAPTRVRGADAERQGITDVRIDEGGFEL